MILHEVGAEAFRCFRRPFRIAELDPGINLICGPNEAGKSTLFAALAHALLTHHRSSGRSIEELRPWGTQLSPRVRLVLEVAGRRWRLQKQFLEGRSCRLEREEAGGFLALAEGDAAEERLRQLLGSRAGSRGPGRLAHWAVAELLWVPQGATGQLPELGEELRARLQAGAGGIALSGRETELLRRLDAAQAAVFQEKRGGVRAGSELFRLQREAEELSAAVLRLEQQRGQLDLAAAELSRAVEERDRLRQRRELLAAERRRLQEEEVRLRRHREQLERAQAEMARARSAFEAVDIFRERLAGLQRRLREQDLVIQALGSRQTSLERELDDQLLRYTEQRQQAAALRAELERLERREAWERARQEERALAARIRRLEQLEGELEALLVEQAGSLPVPDRQTLESAERLWEARARVRAAGTLHLRLQAARSLRLRHQGEVLELRPGEVHERDGLGVLELEVEELGGLRVELIGYDLPGAEAAEAAWSAFLSLQRAGDLQELRQRHLRAAARSESIDRLGGERQRLLGSDGSLEGLRDLRRSLRKRAGGLQGELPVGVAVELAEAADPRAALEEVRLRLARNADALQGTQAALEALRRQASELAVERQGSEVTRRAAQADLDEISARYGSSEEMLGRWREARQQFDMAVDRLAELRNAAPGDALEAEEGLVRLNAELQIADAKERELRDRTVSAETRLQDASAAGLYDQLVLAREHQARVQRELRRADRRARAGRLLLQLGRRIHDDLSSGLAGPLAQELASALERVSGRGGRQIRLGDDLALHGLTLLEPDGEATLADPRALSGGTLEQLGLLYRLALGRLLAGEERLTVVLDDPLGETDLQRQAQLLELLAAESQRLQILILTCHPERYAGLPHGRSFELPGP